MLDFIISALTSARSAAVAAIPAVVQPTVKAITVDGFKAVPVVGAVMPVVDSEELPTKVAGVEAGENSMASREVRIGCLLLSYNKITDIIPTAKSRCARLTLCVGYAACAGFLIDVSDPLPPPRSFLGCLPQATSAPPQAPLSSPHACASPTRPAVAFRPPSRLPPRWSADKTVRPESDTGCTHPLILPSSERMHLASPLPVIRVLSYYRSGVSLRCNLRG